MFAYCGNNPVNYFDKTGRAPDSLAGWAGAAIGEWLYELFTGRTHPNKQAREIETQIIQKQNEIVADTSKALWNGYVHSNELSVQSQYERDMMVLNTTDYLKKNPLVAVDAVAGIVGTGLSYVGYATAAAGVSVPIIGQIIMGIGGVACGVWGLYRLAMQVI